MSLGRNDCCASGLLVGRFGGDFLAEPLKDFGIKVGRLAVGVAWHRESPEDLDFLVRTFYCGASSRGRARGPRKAEGERT